MIYGKPTFLKIAEMEEKISQQEGRAAENNACFDLIDTFVPSGESVRQLSFECDSEGYVRLDLALVASGEFDCAVFLKLDGAVLARLNKKIKYSDRLLKTFFCGAGKHSVAFCFENDGGAFTLEKITAALSGVGVRSPEPPALSSVFFDGENIFVTATSDTVQVTDSQGQSLKTFDLSCRKVQLAASDVLRILCLSEDGQLTARTVFGQNASVSLGDSVRDFCFVGGGSDRLYMLSDRQILRTDYCFDSAQTSLFDENVFFDRISKVRAVSFAEGDLLFVQGRGGIYAAMCDGTTVSVRSKLPVRGLVDARRSEEKCEVLVLQNGTARNMIYDVQTDSFAAGGEVCFCDAACFAGDGQVFAFADGRNFLEQTGE